MRLAIDNKLISGVVTAPEAIAISHRYLICQALTKEHTLMACRNNSKAILATKRCLKELGLPDILKRRDLAETIGRIDCNDNFDTFRFLLPIAATIGRPCEFILNEKLLNSPIEGLFKALKIHGIRHEFTNRNMMKIWGRLTAGTFIVPGDTCSQFLSGMLFALPLLKDPSTIIVQGQLESQEDISMTLEILEESGITISSTITDLTNGSGKADQKKLTNMIGATFKIPGNQTYRFRGVKKIEGDWTFASYYLAAASVCGGPVTVSGLYLDSCQKEKNIIEILKKAGADISIHYPKAQEKEKEEFSTARTISDMLFGKMIEKELVDIRVGADKRANAISLKAFEADSKELNNLYLPLILLASAAKGISVIKNVSDADEIIDSIQELGINIWENEGNLYIEGFPGLRPLTGGCISSMTDWQKAMMGVMSACMSSGIIEIEGGEVLEDIYPGFYETFLSLQK